VAKCSIATTESFKDPYGQYHNITDWHSIVMWRGLAELAEKYLHKGSLIYLEGKLKNRTFEDKDGQKRTVTEIIAESFLMLDKVNSKCLHSSKGLFYCVYPTISLYNCQKMKIFKVIHKGQSRIKIDFPYNQHFTAIIKQIKDARWSQQLNAWHIPDDKSSFYRLKTLSKALGSLNNIQRGIYKIFFMLPYKRQVLPKMLQSIR
jgi:single-strand DNA-binding protein